MVYLLGEETGIKFNPEINIKNYYSYHGRFHLFSSSAEFRGNQGDAAKKAALEFLSQYILTYKNGTSARNDFNDFVSEVKNNNYSEDARVAYETICQGTGVVTRLFNLKTSSYEALEGMFASAHLESKFIYE